MEEIKDAITSLMRQLQQKQEVSRHDNPTEWLKKILTKKELKHIKIDYFRQGTLGVSVDSSSWLYTLGIKKAELLAKLKKESLNIKDIHLRIGEF
ncbi:MAG: DciA family protein [Candidatus Omnitrophica bacterium]|nr:DciA family protein [Candidatus Omnitrophota bacterium]